MIRPPVATFPLLMDSRGVLLAVLDKTYDAHIQDALLTADNGQEVLDFSLALNDPKAKLIQAEYQVFYTWTQFRVRTVTAGFDAQGTPSYQVHCEAEWYNLGAGNPIASFTTTSPTTALTSALAGTGWTVGVVQPAAGPTFVSDPGATPLAVIRALPGVFGGEIQFDNINRKVHLYTVRGAQTQLMYARGKNAATDQVTVDSTNFYTRVYPLGANGLDPGAVNAAVKYVEDYSYYDSIGQPHQIRSVTVTNDQLTTASQVLAYGQTQLSLVSKPAISYRFQAALLRTDTLPNLGDTVKVTDRALSIQTSARVTDRDYYPLEPWRDVITINTSSYTLAQQLAQGGATGTPGGGTKDVMPPAAPTGILVTVNTSFNAQGNRQVTATISWAAVSTNQEGSDLTDFAHYEVQFQLDGGAWVPLGYTEDVQINTPSIVVQSTIVARVRAVDQAGNGSTWDSSASTPVTADNTPPNTPSTLTLSNTLPLTIEAAWDGHDSNGAVMPPDFAYLEVHMGTTTGFTPSTSTLIDIQTSSLGGVTPSPNLSPGTTYYFKSVAVDRAKNRSSISIEVSMSPASFNGPQYFAAGSIDVGSLRAGTVTADIITGTGKIRTASSGQRVELNSSGIQSFNAAGTKLFQLASAGGTMSMWNAAGAQTLSMDGNGNLVISNGTVQTAASGARVIMGFYSSLVGANALNFISAAGNLGWIRQTSQFADIGVEIGVPHGNANTTVRPIMDLYSDVLNSGGQGKRVGYAQAFLGFRGVSSAAIVYGIYVDDSGSVGLTSTVSGAVTAQGTPIGDTASCLWQGTNLVAIAAQMTDSTTQLRSTYSQYAQYTFGGAYTNGYSDASYKKDIERNPHSVLIPQLRQLQPVKFTHKASGKRHLGFLANEVKDHAPDAYNAVPKYGDPDDPNAHETLHGYSHDAMLSMLVAGWQHLDERLAAIEAKE